MKPAEDTFTNRANNIAAVCLGYFELFVLQALSEGWDMDRLRQEYVQWVLPLWRTADPAIRDIYAFAVGNLSMLMTEVPALPAGADELRRRYALDFQNDVATFLKDRPAV